MIKKTLLGAAVAALSLASFDASAFAKGRRGEVAGTAAAITTSAAASYSCR